AGYIKQRRRSTDNHLLGIMVFRVDVAGSIATPRQRGMGLFIEKSDTLHAQTEGG
ncbi:hypothetical protein CDAR_551981, partial [Caerostris darwini]